MRTRGLSLIEVMLMVAILAIVATSFCAALLSSMNVTREASEHSAAAHLAREKLEQIENSAFDQIKTVWNGKTFPLVLSVGNTIQGAVTTGTTSTTVTDSAAAFPTSGQGLIGQYVYFYDNLSKDYRDYRKITSNTTTTITWASSGVGGGNLTVNIKDSYTISKSTIVAAPDGKSDACEVIICTNESATRSSLGRDIYPLDGMPDGVHFVTLPMDFNGNGTVSDGEVGMAATRLLAGVVIRWIGAGGREERYEAWTVISKQ